MKKILFAVGLTLVGCSTSIPQSDYLSDSQSEIKRHFSGNPLLLQGLSALLADDPAEASRLFNLVLQGNPKEPLANFLNGFAYHMLSKQQGYGKDLAKVGYTLALKFDPHLWHAAYQLGFIALEDRDHLQAAEFFSKAALAAPLQSEPYYALAAASYMGKDLETAYGAIKQAEQLDPDPTWDFRVVSGVIHAAVGDFDQAWRHADFLKPAGAPKQTIQQTRKAIRSIAELSAMLEKAIPLLSDANDESPPLVAATATSSTPKTALIDAIIMTTSGSDVEQRGINLLEQLSLQFSGTILNYSGERLKDDAETSDTEKYERGLSLTIPEVNYNLNIFNSYDSFTKIVGQPTVMAVDGEESSFFIGSELTFLTGGDWESVADKSVGLSLKVTPTFYEAGQVKLDAALESSAFTTDNAQGGFLASLQVNKTSTKISAVMDFGQTLVVSTGTNTADQRQDGGVTGLREMPLVEDFFGTKFESTRNVTVMILLTLRHTTDETPTRQPQSLRIAKRLLSSRVARTPQIGVIRKRLDRLRQAGLLAEVAPVTVMPNGLATNSVPNSRVREKFLFDAMKL